jgi:hypothetical protein
MKKIKNYLAALSLLTIGVVLFSFSPKGGEGFEIYLNNKLVMQQFGSQMASVKSFPIDQRFSNDQLTVKYYHCGQVGKNRHITIKDGQNKVIKEWRFNDDSKNAAMNCPVKEILSFQKGNAESKLGLYYSSSELPKERLLVSIVLTTENKAKAVTK